MGVSPDCNGNVLSALPYLLFGQIKILTSLIVIDFSETSCVLWIRAHEKGRSQIHPGTLF
jgi:hypothetical protein